MLTIDQDIRVLIVTPTRIIFENNLNVALSWKNPTVLIDTSKPAIVSDKIVVLVGVDIKKEP